MHFDFVMGVNGGISGTLRDFSFLRGSIPADATYTVAGIGRYEFPLAVAAIIDGGHVRVGFEDNTMIAKGKMANSNGELVEKVVRLAKELGREIANPAEAREILGLKQR
jgi:3-keto-5-aminohexanoate cleavage enzyme